MTREGEMDWSILFLNISVGGVKLPKEQGEKTDHNSSGPYH